MIFRWDVPAELFPNAELLRRMWETDDPLFIELWREAGRELNGREFRGHSRFDEDLSIVRRRRRWAPIPVQTSSLKILIF